MYVKGTLEGKPDLTQDIALHNKWRKSIYVGRETKNLELLGRINFKKAWINSIPSRDMEKIVPLLNVGYLSIYNVQAKDLSLLEGLDKCETLLLEWNSKADKLWDFKKTKQIKHLAIRDFSKIVDLYPLADAFNIENLAIEGGLYKQMKVLSLKPLASLKNLKTLRLANIRVLDNSLDHLKELKNLRKLWLSNQFSTEDFARLSVELPKVDCIRFKPFEKVKVYDKQGGIEFDRMITGKRKPFLHSKRDKEKIEEHKSRFQELQNTYKKALKH